MLLSYLIIIDQITDNIAVTLISITVSKYEGMRQLDKMLINQETCYILYTPSYRNWFKEVYKTVYQNSITTISDKHIILLFISSINTKSFLLHRERAISYWGITSNFTFPVFSRFWMSLLLPKATAGVYTPPLRVNRHTVTTDEI